MSEVIQWAQLDEIQSTIATLQPSEPCYMYLERVPDRWLTDDERQNGLRLEQFAPEEDFNAWERGRIFCQTLELRWETLNGAFHAVYAGEPIDLPGFTRTEDLDLADKTIEERSYLLWGNRVPDDQVETVGVKKREDQQVFIEFQVPRVLHYPVSDQTQQVRLRVREYLDPGSGERCYYRFLGLKELP